jgi:hypothetical protein
MVLGVVEVVSVGIVEVVAVLPAVESGVVAGAGAGVCVQAPKTIAAIRVISFAFVIVFLLA